MIHFTLYSRSYCHLCDDMLTALQAYRAKHLFAVDVIDIDADDALVEKFDELVPVLLGRKDDGETVQLFHYFLNAPVLEAFLAST